MSSRKEIRQEIIRITDTNESQISTLVNDNINATLQEIANPGWAFSRRNELHHNWSWLRRATTFATVASQESYVLGRDVANISVMRYASPDTLLKKMTDYRFYRMIPAPTDTGNPEIFRQSQISGIATTLAVADKINVVSSSTSDDGDSDLVVSVTGFSNGILVTETYTLDGTTLVSGTITFDAREIYVSKLKDTTGIITITENSGSTTLTTLGSQDRTPIHPVVSLYPIPSSVKTIYVSYYTQMRNLNNDSDTPLFREHWHYVVRLGALAKTYQYLNKEESFNAAQSLYSSAVRAMVAEDRDDPSYIPELFRNDPFLKNNNFGLKRATDAIA